MNKNRSLMLSAGSLTLLFLFSSMGIAQNRFLTSVKDQLVTAAATFDGFTMTHDPYTGQLNSLSSKNISLTLRKDTAYLIVAVCDQDCSDIDLALYDENDNLVASDTEDDDSPIVSISPRWTGSFRLRVTMAQCDTEPCYYGIGVFGQ